MKLKNLPKVISSKADDLLESAEKEDLVHGLLGLLPAGGVLDTILFRRIKNSAKVRLEEFNCSISAELNNINENKVDKKFIESEEFDSLVMNVVARTIWESSQEKRAYFRAVLLNSVTFDFSQSPLKEVMIELIAELSPMHVKILQLFSEHSLPTHEYDDYGYDPSDACKIIKGLQPEDASAVGEDMCRKSILIISDSTYRTMKITSLGTSLLKFIRDPNEI